MSTVIADVIRNLRADRIDARGEFLDRSKHGHAAVRDGARRAAENALTRVLRILDVLETSLRRTSSPRRGPAAGTPATS